MFGTVGSPYLLIQAINIILTHILPNVVVLFISAKLRLFAGTTKFYSENLQKGRSSMPT